uniref:ribonuclease H n=1 Tax=Amphiprion percula TaxID=161767 RepID=A0A3P8TBN5_AMPPE
MSAAEGEVQRDGALSSESDREETRDSATEMATTVQLLPPEPFDFSCPSEWPKWIRRFERFRIATDLDSKTEEYQVNSLLYAMGDAADDVLAVLPLTAEDKKKYEAVKVIFERAQFNSRRQQDGESAEIFITAVHKLAENCGFGVLKEELIRDRIVVGIKDKRLSEQLQMDSELTLPKAIQKVRQSETVKKQQTILHSSSAEDKTLNMDSVRTNMKKGKTQTWQQSKKGQKPVKQFEKECGRCGRKNKHSWKECPAREVQCRKCQKKGHFAVVCRSSEAAGLKEVTENQDDTDSEECVFLGEIGTERSQPWTEKVTLNGTKVEFKLDTGADVTSIPDKLYRPERDGRLQKPTKKLLGPGNHPLKVKGCFGAQLEAKGRSMSQDVYLVSGLVQPLLSRPACEALGLVYRVDSVKESETDFRAAYRDVFQGLGMLKEPYHIELEQGAIPVALSAPRRVPLPLRDAVREELNRMEEMGVISKVTEPTEWCSGIVVIPRPAKKPPSICVDLTPLNTAVKRERHILPAVDQTLAMMKDAKVFTKLDARSGFWQIPLTPESRSLTTFITPFGRYQFNRLPFGIASAPEHFQRRMSQMLEDFDGVVCHADDVLVYGRDRQEYDQRLHRVLQKFQKEGLTLNEKCEFAKKEIMFVGHKVSAKGIEADPSKVKAIQQLPQPKCVEDVRRLLGMANYLAKFMPQLATITTPLKELQKERNEWIWAEPQETAFQKLKEILSSPEVLAQYSNTADTRVAADASPYGVGAVLTQKQSDGTWRPVTYISRGLTDTERRYAQIEKEALAVTWSCERLSSYLMGLQFTLITDHKPLVPLLSTRGLDDLPPRILRFRLRLLRFSFEIIHVPGKNLVTADALSRAPVRGPPSADELQLEKEVEVFVDSVVSCLPATEKRLEEIKSAQEKDELCKKVKDCCLAGWPEKCKLDADIILLLLLLLLLL